MDRRTFLARSAPVALVGLAGCTGGDDTSDPDDTPTPTATDSSTPTATATGTPTDATDTPTATEEPTDSPTPTEESTPTPQPDAEVVVAPDGALRFEPRSFTIAAGDSVRWTWDSGGHNVSPTDGQQPEGANWAGRDESLYSSGTTHVHTFEVAGTYEYHCDPHQTSGMTGSFTVE